MFSVVLYSVFGTSVFCVHIHCTYKGICLKVDKGSRVGTTSHCAILPRGWTRGPELEPLATRPHPVPGVWGVCTPRENSENRENGLDLWLG